MLNICYGLIHDFRLFSDEGKSYSFDNRGTGFGRGEGCGVIVLKSLDDAIKSNDPIRAVIRGTGMNQDGRTPGITMPNGSAQGTEISFDEDFDHLDR